MAYRRNRVGRPQPGPLEVALSFRHLTPWFATRGTECREICLRRGSDERCATCLHHFDPASLPLLVEFGSTERHLPKPNVDPPSSGFVVTNAAVWQSTSPYRF